MESSKTLYKQFKHEFYRQNKANFILALLTMLLLACGNLLISWLLQQIIDVATGAGGEFTLRKLSLISVMITIGFVVTLLLQRQLSPRFIQKAMEQYKSFVFQKLTRKGIHSFSEENTATYVSALSNDATSIETNYLAKLFPLAQDLLLFAGAFALMLYYSPLLTLAAFLLSLFPVVASILTGNRLALQEKAVSDQNERFLDTIKDMLSGFSVIKSFKAEQEALRLFTDCNREVETAKCSRRKTEILILTFSTVAGIIAQFGVFLIGAYLALERKGITAGVVIVFVQLMNYVISPIADVPQVIAARQAKNALLMKMATAIASNVRQDGIPVNNQLQHGIKLKHLSFSYEDTPVLNDISVQFEPGKSYAIVGSSGSGKSTLLNLLMGGYENYEGEILYDTTELRNISSDSLYDLVSIVQQNVFIFNSSVYHNITMFREFSEQRLHKVTKMAGLTSLLEERGHNYQCGENGCGLSGGERQRISIARCLLRDTPVMLVDEATAALDTKTAAAVTRSILNIADLTRIIVTHRLEEALLRQYDQIIVLKNGTINEAGTFEELMKRKEYFYSLYTVAQ